MSTSEKSPVADTQVKEIAKGIEETRAGMTATVSQLERRLGPSELGEAAKAELDHLETRVKGVMKEGLKEAGEVLDEKMLAAKHAVHEEILEAKGALKEQLHETKDIVAQGLADARQTLKQDIQSAMTHARQSVREATIGRVEDIATKAGDAMNSTRDTLVDTIRQNPVPATLAGIGLAWLLMNRSNSSRRRMAVAGRPMERGPAGSVAAAARSGVEQGVSAVSHLADSAGEVVTHAGQATTQMMHDARDAAGNLIHSAGETASQFAHQAQHVTTDLAIGTASQVRRVERALEDTFEGNPLALGAVALAVGAAVGYSLPRTEREDELMGELRDRVLSDAGHIVEGATQSLGHVVSDVEASAKEVVAAVTK